MQGPFTQRFQVGTKRYLARPVVTNTANICVVDPDSATREKLEALLSTASTKVTSFDSAEALLDNIDNLEFNLLITEMALPGMDGLALLTELRKRGVSVPSIFLTTDTEIAPAVSVMRAGAIDCIEKPVVGPLLFARVKRALGIEA